MKTEDRVKVHAKNREVEKVLLELKGLLENVDKEVSVTNSPDFPNIYIVGCARSGTTLLYQVLCKFLPVTYPSNLLSRFYFAPYIGSKIQYLFSDLDYKGELLSVLSDFDFKSDLGKTKGPLAPHEFWYYWRSVFKINELGYVDNPTKDQVSEFQYGLTKIKQVFNKPLVLKAMIANNSISTVIKDRPNDIILYVKRNTLFNAQSLYFARQKFYGDVSKWYSFGITEKQKFTSPLEEVAAQVKYTNQIIEKELESVPKGQVFQLNYEDINQEINSLLNTLSMRLNFPAFNGVDVDFEVNDVVKLGEEEWRLLEKFDDIVS